MEKLYYEDKERYISNKMPLFQKYFRKCQSTNNFIKKIFYKIIFKLSRIKNCIELSEVTKIGGGLYIGHPYCITINPKAILGKNINIHKGVTIGQENRGKRKGTPVIGNNVWIGVNSVIVGKIIIGDDVLIAPNTYINCDIPSHSVVFGNPCIVKYKKEATKDYINNKV